MVKTSDNDHIDDQLGRAVEDYFHRLRSGERPQLDDFVEQYPEIKNLLETVIPGLQAAEQSSDESLNGNIAYEPVKQLGDFRILRQIGRGGMGVVYEAEQISMQRRVALKVLPLAGLLDDLKIRRFQNEVRAAATLDHPNIVSVYMVGEERGVHYYAMKLIRGRSMADVISSLQQIEKEGSRLDGSSISEMTSSVEVDERIRSDLDASTEFARHDSRQSERTDRVETVAQADDSTIPHSSKREYFRSVASLGIQVATALQHAHDHGIIHRDIKPANLLLDGKSNLHLTDFGLARYEADVGLTMTGDVVGTLRYMAPERALAKRTVVDHRADIYSLGATLYELLALQPAYGAIDRHQLLKQIAFEEPTSLRRVDRAIPAELATIVHKAMSKDFADRYATAQELADDLGSYLQNRSIKAQPPSILEIIGKWSRRNPILTGATAVIAMTVAVCLFLVLKERGRFISRDESASKAESALEKERWAHTQALPEIQRLIDAEKFADALSLAEEAELAIPHDPALLKLLTDCSVETSITSDPPGVDVAQRNWNTAIDQWNSVGTTPIETVRLPKGQLHWRLTKQDYVSLLLLRAASPMMSFRLQRSVDLPQGMVLVPGNESTFISLVGIPRVERPSLGDFLIDRYEVTNHQFQEFVDRGGYTSPQYWMHVFPEGSTPSWEDAIAQFVDSTGRPGPAGWESGRFPEGTEDYPVGGVSWFEAAAYAEYMGKRLPSIYHWDRAADLWAATYIVPLSNFSRQRPAPIGQYRGVGGHGAFDMAGNVKEWCWNEAGESKRYLLGGAWNEPEYMFNDPDDQSPFSRSDTYGFRCVKVVDEENTSPNIDNEIIRHRRHFSKETPAPDSEFAIYKSLYSYDTEAPLNEVVSPPDERDGYWYERIEFDAAYGGERVIAHFYRPSHVAPPYQTVIYFPPAYTLYQRHFDTTGISGQIAFYVEHGRAVLYPIYKGTYERPTSLPWVEGEATALYRDHVLYWYKDVARSIDYIMTRPDVQDDRLAYYGYSWGGSLAPVLLAVEDRLTVAILSGAGFSEPETFPVVSPINFAPRVTIPVLMLSGRYNTFFPVEKAVEPMYQLLGTPEANKRLLTFDSGQFIPQKDLTREAIGWLDEYLGPVVLTD